jgi:peptidoglycan hydrolase-like protein with peptidoglycan-binding domain
VYGRLTQQAVAAFQEDQGLNPDGKVGPATRAALAEALGLIAIPSCG